MSPQTTPDPELRRELEESARRYLRSLPPEHFMEATPQATQRKVTVASFDVIGHARPDIQTFSELLVQYPRGKRKKRGQVVPDNMVVVHPAPLHPLTSFGLEEQPARPFLVLEYVSKGSERKDYDANYETYEEELKVPYYLLFYPDNEELTLFRLTDGKYVSVKPNASGRLPVPELELEAALLGGWVRFWFRGGLVPLPAELVDQRDGAERRAAAAEQRAITAEQAAAAERQARAAVEAELARLREELARAKGGG